MIRCALIEPILCPIANTSYRVFVNSNSNSPHIDIGGTSQITAYLYSDDTFISQVTPLRLNPGDYTVFFNDVELPTVGFSTWRDVSTNNELYIAASGQLTNNSAIYMNFPVGGTDYALNIKIYKLGILDSEADIIFSFNSEPVDNQLVDTMDISVSKGSLLGHVKYDQEHKTTVSFSGMDCPPTVTTENYPLASTTHLYNRDADKFRWKGASLHNLYTIEEDLWVNFVDYTAELNGVTLTPSLPATGNTLFMYDVTFDYYFSLHFNGIWDIQDDNTPVDPLNADFKLYKEGVLKDHVLLKGYDYVNLYAASISVEPQINGVSILIPPSDFIGYSGLAINNRIGNLLPKSPYITMGQAVIHLITNSSTNNMLDMVTNSGDYSVEIDGETFSSLVGGGTNSPSWVFASNSQFSINGEADQNSGNSVLHIDNIANSGDITVNFKIRKLGVIVSDVTVAIFGNVVAAPYELAEYTDINVAVGTMFGDVYAEDQNSDFYVQRPPI